MPSRFRPDRCGLLLIGKPGGVLEILEHGAEFEGSRIERWLVQNGEDKKHKFVVVKR